MPAAIAMPSASATGATGRLRAGATCKREPFVRVRVDTTAWMGISATADRLPPGPRFAALQAARFARGPVAFLESMRRRYGDVFTVPFPFFERLVYLADPESIKQVFKGDPRVFHAGEGNAGPLGPVVGDRSVFVLDEDEHIYGEIARRRADSDAASRDDVLSLLLQARREDGSPMTDVELRDELVTTVAAGHETTATGLAWLFERLLRHPDVEERLRASLADGDDSYLDAVVKETLRVRPVVVDVVRGLTQDTEIAEWRLPA